ncbi:hypothetical protein BGW80DRAFT_1252046 [Lactifluus volemus]|nr:hypothetical protein BGW80DRAFT_1252046 [Lactifluus volemus]
MSSRLSTTRGLKKPRGRASRRLTSNKLNDDILLNIFHLYQLDYLYTRDEEDSSGRNVRLRWDRQRWWYKLAQVCRKWRCLILASPIRLDIHLLCSYGVPVADMLAHSPPLPLAIWYSNGDREMTAKDEEDALLALSHHDRVHRISLCMPASKLGKFINAMDDEFPILEHIRISSGPGGSTGQMFPTTFHAPNLRHAWTSCRPIGSPLVTATVGLVSLELMDVPSSPWFPPSYILARLSLMPQLTTLRIHFHSPHPNRDVESPAATHVMLPNLQVFSYRGVTAYLEGLARIRAPILSVLDVRFFNQLTFTVPRLMEFMETSESLVFNSVDITFNENSLELMTGPDPSQQQRALCLQITCKHLDWQVASAVQIFDSISPVLSGVEELTLSHVAHDRSSHTHDEVDRTQWRKLFRLFSNVKSLGVPESLSGVLSHSLRSANGEMSPELLPNLLVLQYLGRSTVGDVFTSFINERQAAGHSVNLVASSSLYTSWHQMQRLQKKEQRRLQKQQRRQLQKEQRRLQQGRKGLKQVQQKEQRRLQQEELQQLQQEDRKELQQQLQLSLQVLQRCRQVLQRCLKLYPQQQ